MDESEIQKLKGLYISTAKEYLEDLKQNIIALKKSNEDIESIAKAYISSHSLKSQSLVMQYKGIGQVSGTLEFVFRDIKEGNKTLDTRLLDLIEHAVMTIGFALQEIEAGSGEPDLSDVIHELESGSDIHFSV